MKTTQTNLTELTAEQTQAINGGTNGRYTLPSKHNPGTAIPDPVGVPVITFPLNPAECPPSLS
jgi:hypothetical protein